MQTDTLLISPRNIAWALFAIQLCLIPAVVAVRGYALGQLPTLPGNSVIALSEILTVAGYGAFLVGMSTGVDQRGDDSRDSRPVSRSMSRLAILLGALGFSFRFSSLGSLLKYFSGDFTGNVVGTGGSASVVGALSTFFRPLIIPGLLLEWQSWHLRRRTSGRSTFILVCLASVVVMSTYNYNRAAAAIPVIALVGSYSRCVRRVSFWRVALLLLTLLMVGYLFGNVRRTILATQGGRISVPASGVGKAPSFESQLQVYGQAPQFEAYVILHGVDRSGLLYGSSILASALAPIPRIGSNFRGTTGTARYNVLIYGPIGAADQILSYNAELYWNFGLVGVLLGFMILGALLDRIDRAYRRSSDVSWSYLWLFLGSWLSFLVIDSILVVSQVVVYFVLPTLILLSYREVAVLPITQASRDLPR